MQAPSFLVAVAILSSSISILSVLFFSYDVFCELNAVFAIVESEVHVFKESTNEAWDTIMGIQWKLEESESIRAAKRRSIVERDVFVDKKGHRVKTRQNIFLQRRLPAWCQCEPAKPLCPPGPRGPPGERGAPGMPGERGQPGNNNYETIRIPQNCDLRETGCIRCPAGPPGLRGATGDIGRPGPMGVPGSPGEAVAMGPVGPTGPPGDQGPSGANGMPGEPGAPGKPGVVMVYKRGPPGLPGDGGLRGPPGRPGALGAPGIPGPMGPPGPPGHGGARGEPGRPGPLGRPGSYGRDAGYCPCPKRSMFIAAKKIRI